MTQKTQPAVKPEHTIRLSEGQLKRLNADDIEHIKARIEARKSIWANEPTDYLVAVLAKLEAIQQEA